MQETILILDFGSQVTQLIGRRLRELNVYCEIHPYNKIPEITDDIKGVILSGSPSSVRDANAPFADISGIKGRLPLLGICYGAQFIAYHYGGEVNSSLAREYGRAMLTVTEDDCKLFEGVSRSS
ncbi:MAG: GMP synthase (glutamine-hydrolyzing), partial [Bacteroidales bacterium]|nr:GMP synthase (glutamine-hydrolyzing) [Bacteroidales bacterium]